MFHGHSDYSQKPLLGGRPNTKPGDHGTLNAHNRWFILFYHVWGPAWIEIHWNSIGLRAWSHMTLHYTWGSVTHYMILEVSWDNLWTLSFRLSQFRGHDSWLMCEVVLSLTLFKQMCIIYTSSVALYHGPKYSQNQRCRSISRKSGSTWHARLTRSVQNDTGP